jgi:hypothetical protein
MIFNGDFANLNSGGLIRSFYVVLSGFLYFGTRRDRTKNRSVGKFFPVNFGYFVSGSGSSGPSSGSPLLFTAIVHPSGT